MKGLCLRSLAVRSIPICFVDVGVTFRSTAQTFIPGVNYYTTLWTNVRGPAATFNVFFSWAISCPRLKGRLAQWTVYLWRVKCVFCAYITVKCVYGGLSPVPSISPAPRCSASASSAASVSVSALAFVVGHVHGEEERYSRG